jgi:hypothetical protein
MEFHLPASLDSVEIAGDRSMNEIIDGNLEIFDELFENLQ